MTMRRYVSQWGKLRLAGCFPPVLAELGANASDRAQIPDLLLLNTLEVLKMGEKQILTLSFG